MSVLAIIPARKSSKGIAGKNFRDLCGESPLLRAIRCANECDTIDAVVVTTDCAETVAALQHQSATSAYAVDGVIQRPAKLATDEAAMVDVVKHAIHEAGQYFEFDRVVLLQCTQPLRTPAHVTRALALLTPEVDSVVSVVELPKTHRPDVQMTVISDRLWRWVGSSAIEDPLMFNFPPVRQRGMATVIRDGTVYAFHRRTVETWGNIYGSTVRPLLIAPEDTCPLDEPRDWADAERRLKEREG